MKGHIGVGFVALRTVMSQLERGRGGFVAGLAGLGVLLLSFVEKTRGCGGIAITRHPDGSGIIFGLFLIVAGCYVWLRSKRDGGASGTY